ncbi:acyltransferase family protein [Elizabethkingia miricola]|uniref:acyltransferase family protein n=1 Tax=Elizabethkingia miricola TaxID=172045 RepID=UPI00099AE067|nr:hypothetical protein BAY01_13825 [Elizabethkingia miricola]
MKRNISLDILKFILAFFVIGLHGSLFYDINPYLSFTFVSGLFRVAVPLFILITGFFFAEISNNKGFIKWCKRILFLYIFWNIIYLPLWYHKGMSPKIFTFIITNGFLHLWYISHMLVASFFVWFTRKLSIKKGLILAISLYLIGCFLQYLANYSKNNFITQYVSHLYIYRNFLFFCFPFFYLGYALNKGGFKFKNYIFYISIFLFIIEITINTFLSYYYSKDLNFDLLVSLIILCPLIFIKTKEILLISSTKYIALLSSGIYFIHILTFYFIDILISPTSSLLRILLCSILSLILASILIIINKYLKFKIL